MPATISVNFASQSEVENSPQPTNKSVSAKVLADVLGGGSLGGGYVRIAGSTMTGALTLNGAPTQNLHAATKKYVDDNAYQRKYRYTVSGSPRSTVSGVDDIGNTLTFVATTNVDVYRNGILLVGNGIDYTADPNTDTITFTTQLAVGAVVQVNVGGVGSIPSNSGVNQIQAGTGIALSPVGGTGTVTVGVNPSYDRFVPAGAIMAFGMNSAPSGWLICNGDTIGTTGTVQGVAASLLQTLRGLLGASHGTTGQLPDLRGIFVRGSGGPQTVGGLNFSGTFAAKEADDFRSHSHGATASSSSSGTVKPNRGNLQNAAGLATGQNQASNQTYPLSITTTTSVSISPQGGTETRPANISLLYCIKY